MGKASYPHTETHKHMQFLKQSSTQHDAFFQTQRKRESRRKAGKNLKTYGKGIVVDILQKQSQARTLIKSAFSFVSIPQEIFF